MSETPATYDCGISCTCDAATDLAAERTGLIVEMAAALMYAQFALSDVGVNSIMSMKTRGRVIKARTRVSAVLAKYRGEEVA